VIRWAKSLGIDCGDEGPVDLDNDPNRPERNSVGYHLIDNNEISDNGICGIAGHRSRNTIVRYNLIERNNRLANPWAESAGIKFHGLDSGIIEGNIVRDNDCAGIWLDWGWYGARISRNTVIGNSGQGIFIELGSGNCMVDNNIVAYTRMGDGIYTHDASGVTIAHNLLFCNAHFGFYARIVTERKIANEAGKRELCGTHDLKIFNNTFIDNYRGHICLPPDDGKRVFQNK
jgi:parallel beta-helix repeat protein